MNDWQTKVYIADLIQKGKAQQMTPEAIGKETAKRVREAVKGTKLENDERLVEICELLESEVGTDDSPFDEDEEDGDTSAEHELNEALNDLYTWGDRRQRMWVNGAFPESQDIIDTGD